ncbi:MAG: alpha/beta fold hydrolase [Desulfobacterales bacterium]
MKKRLFIPVQMLLLGLLVGCASTQQSIYNFMIDRERGQSDLVYKTVAVEGETVSYLEREGEGETIVLLHGFTADKNNWLRFVRNLPEKYRVLALDMPGHGDNVQDMNRNYSPFSLSRGIAETVDAMGIKRFHLAGNSLGGLVSKIYASEHPDRIITVGLFDSAGVISPTPSEFRILLEKGENPFVVKTREDYDRLGEYAFHDKPFLPWPIHSVMARKYIENNNFYQKMFGDLEKSDTFDNQKVQNKILEGLKMPVFVIWGDKDRLIHVSSVEVYQKELPQVEAVILKDCGHLPMLERPEESATHYAQFINNHPDL